MRSRLMLLTAFSWLCLAPSIAAAQGASAGSPGGYVGVHVGSLLNRVHYNEPDEPEFAFTGDARGLVAGGLAGWNLRLANSVMFGFEVDVSGASVRFAADSVGGNEYSAVHLDLNAHLRARVGRAWGGSLVYVAGGLAIARIGVDDVDTGWGQDDQMRRGWTIGAGVEHAITGRWHLRAEYLHDHYGLGHYEIAAPPDGMGTPFYPSYRADVEAKSHSLRGALVWRF